jgi:hypothetical protein
MFAVAVISHLPAFIDVRVAFKVGVTRGTLASVSHSTNVAALSVNALSINANTVVNIRALKTTQRLLDVREGSVFGDGGSSAISVSILVAIFARALEGPGGVNTVSIAVTIVNVQLALSYINIAVGISPPFITVASEGIDTSVNTHTSWSPDRTRARFSEVTTLMNLIATVFVEHNLIQNPRSRRDKD